MTPSVVRTSNTYAVLAEEEPILMIDDPSVDDRSAGEWKIDYFLYWELTFRVPFLEPYIIQFIFFYFFFLFRFSSPASTLIKM